MGGAYGYLNGGRMNAAFGWYIIGLAVLVLLFKEAEGSGISPELLEVDGGRASCSIELLVSTCNG